MAPQPDAPAPPAPHNLIFDGCVNNLQEAPAIGNGDLGALVQVFQDEFRLHLGKCDVFDARFDYQTDASVFKQEDLIRASQDHGFRLEGGAYAHQPAWDDKPHDLDYPDDLQGWGRHPFPGPKPAGRVSVKLSGTSSTRIRTEVDLSRGLVRAQYDLEYGWHGRGTLLIEAFVDRQSNTVRMLLERQGLLGRIWLCVEKPPDALDRSLPLPEVHATGALSGVVVQQIPDEFDAGPFAWALAGAFPEGPAVEAQAFQLCQQLALPEGQPVAWAVGVATTRDGVGDPAPRAAHIAGEATRPAYDATREAHVRSWADFWSVSAVELSDKDLEASWYRNLFALACHISPTAPAPGLCANVPPYERSPWHGVYTVNMNIQKMFLASTMTRHTEWIDAYARWLDDMEPSFRHLARSIFDIDGVYSVHMMLPFVPSHRQFNSNTCGRALGMTGWHGQPLWWRWRATRDRRFLRETAYPWFRKAADFYCDYFDRFMDESGDVWPSMNLEGPPWTRDCRHNRDCVIDLITIRKTFEYAIEAAEQLDTDANARQRWRDAMAKVRPVRFEELPQGGWWVYADRHDEPPTDAQWWLQDKYRRQQTMPVLAAWCVFPGEYVEGDEPDGLAAAVRDIMDRCDWRNNHPGMVWIHHWWCAIPALRLGLPDAFEKARELILKERFPAGHARTTHYIDLLPDTWRAPEDNYLGVAATTEMLLQSQGDVLRLFPAWPGDQAAAFRGLTARGGFTVDAAWDPETGLAADIHSTAGRPCRLRWREPASIGIRCGDEPVAVRRDGRDLIFNTSPGQTYCIQTTPG